CRDYQIRARERGSRQVLGGRAGRAGSCFLARPATADGGRRAGGGARQPGGRAGGPPAPPTAGGGPAAGGGGRRGGGGAAARRGGSRLPGGAGRDSGIGPARGRSFRGGPAGAGRGGRPFVTRHQVGSRNPDTRFDRVTTLVQDGTVALIVMLLRGLTMPR